MRSTGRDDRPTRPIVAPDEDLLPQLGQRRDHRAERELRASLAVHDSRTDDRHVRAGVELRHEPIDGPGGHAVSGLSSSTSSEDEVRMPRLFAPRSRDCAPASISRTPGHRRARAPPFRPRGVVDHHDLVRGDRRGLRQRSQDASISRPEL